MPNSSAISRRMYSTDTGPMLSAAVAIMSGSSYREGATKKKKKKKKSKEEKDAHIFDR